MRGEGRPLRRMVPLKRKVVLLRLVGSLGSSSTTDSTPGVNTLSRKDWAAAFAFAGSPWGKVGRPSWLPDSSMLS